MSRPTVLGPSARPRASRSASSMDRGFLSGELIGLMLGYQRVDYRVQPLPFHDLGEIVERQIDPMIGHAPLRKIICANALGSIARSNLILAFGGTRFGCLGALQIVKPGPQDLHGPRPV